ncbi:acetyl/propionyl/methylcrotonyl-CoA carboxylase subunit alpha [Planomonospora parontospora]|uniref:acetyl/propionyl/methylcrotonyl-CoA carboxylase subunit alpha n=1 Tax=Planomonospora parontospora TaxID=58119 RepID=UPI001670C883|nr:biotin carboxylase N-terminal domain-containing protein [Planomonospora parontospora]GGL12964.1 acetyl/propionyl-CoA carboxylase subuit alpha [Planomonospora parontospora subsp. antibiotica]GII13975.1 acetyl/propionyl-CoA carboxylase subuit alpha [Planomonospora parontospora subsp. antibiotica]
MIRRLLVANRGEIARRVFRTCRDLGIETVAVFSDADSGAPHTAEADHAVRLPGVAPAETYLSIGKVVGAALRTGADAVHPGYGFLSESADFARAVLDAGLTWVGPGPEAIAAMGSKIGAKALMAEAGVPVLPHFTAGPGYSMDDLDRDLDAVFARMSGDASGWAVPLLVKASAGGGGRGMRIVRLTDDLPGAVESARREAESAFGDGAVFVEPLLEDARHIEVQVLADAHGTVWTLGERECSIQRRHQKVIEETPSPAVSPALRARLCAAAADAARAVGYVGAGTVEFLVKDDTVAFLEMNTRLQVEHPVTECVYGLDLVGFQLRIAEGGALPPAPPAPAGHAIEARLYAEDPALGWLPQSGVLHRFDVPGVAARFASVSGGLRLDSGVEDGSEVGVHYDPMLAKVIAHGATRADAARRLAGALARARIHGPVTNRDLLVAVLRHEAFLAGATDTGFLDRHGLAAADRGPSGPPGAGLVSGTSGGPLGSTASGEPTASGASAGPGGPDAVPLSALAAALAQAAANRAAATVQAGLPSGWRNVVSQPQHAAFRVGAGNTGSRGDAESPAGAAGPDPSGGGAVRTVAYRITRDGLRAEGFPDTVLVGAAPDLVVLETGGVRHRFGVARHDGVTYVDSPLGSVRLTPLPRLPEPVERPAPGSLLAPMPGTVLRVEVASGDQVTAGQVVVVLEAMKMEHRITAPAAGTVTGLDAAPGRRVEAGAVLAVIGRPE